MLQLAVLAIVLSCAAADGDGNSPLPALPDLPGIKTQDEWNERDKNDIQLYKECDNLDVFQPEMIGWWKGRDQIDSDSYLQVYDIHNILKDGSGIVNAQSGKDHAKISRETPSKMWCKTYPNKVDKAVKVQYGPTKYGQIICIDLELSASRPEEMLVGVNQALFTDARIPLKYPVALDCLNYPYQSKYNSYTIWADNLYRISYSKWYKTQEPKGSDWVPDDKKSSTLLSLLRLLAKSGE